MGCPAILPLPILPRVRPSKLKSVESTTTLFPLVPSDTHGGGGGYMLFLQSKNGDPFFQKYQPERARGWHFAQTTLLGRQCPPQYARVMAEGDRL
jgi:hypothetical protein